MSDVATIYDLNACTAPRLELAQALRCACHDAAAHLQQVPPAPLSDSTQTAALHTRLHQISRPAPPAEAPLLAAAVRRAWATLEQQQPDASVLAHLLDLLTQPGAVFDRFRRVAVEELLLSGQPNIGHLLDCYRRDLRHALPAQGSPPRWTELEPWLRQLLMLLLPRELDKEPALRYLLLAPDERDLLDANRQHATRADHPDTLLADLLDAAPMQQGIIASAGSTIAQVQQTIIVGQPGEPPLTPDELAARYRHYQTFLTETYGLLDFRGILQLQNIVRLRLDDIYVPLTGKLTPSGGAHTALLHARQPPRPQWRSRPAAASPPDDVSLHTLVRDLPFLVVLGDPGAGKSTLVRSILLALVQGHAYQHFGLPGAWLPILFPVAAFAEARSAPGARDLAPLDYLSTYYRGLSQPDYRPLFLRALATGRALLLFDGLDEVRGDRLRLLRCLEAFVREWDAPGNRFVATSRIAGYDDAPLDDRLFVRATVQPLSDEGIRRFIAQWSRAYEQAGAHDLPTDPPAAALELQRRVASRAHELTSAVFTNPNVTALARSPLLLTILALIHQQGSRLPDRRVDLYRLCVEALAETWNRSRSLSGREVDVYLGSEKLDERFVVNLLGPAALWMQQHQPGGLVERKDLERQLASTLRQTDGLPRGRAQRLARSFIALMQYDTGLLQERGRERFGFLHLTFEEYLAARALLESVTVKDPDELIHQHCTDPAWREVLRLMVAAASQREAQRLLLHLLDAPATPEAHGRPVVLAGECLLDIGRNSATQRAWTAVVERLVQLVTSEQPATDTRIAALRVLGALDDPRLLNPRKGDAPTGGYWCSVEAGAYWSSPAHGSTPLHQAELSHSFQLARYPVTTSEYGLFMAAGGYRERRWWSPAGWRFLHDDTHPQPIDQPNHWQHPAFYGSNQPVVGVSWYEAAAYCCWLTEQGHRAGWLAADELVRLPTAAEWQRAARHTDQRLYPWGSAAPTPDHASYADTGAHAPTPVGSFPQGAAHCGAHDMAGNVWEWTATLWEQADEPVPRVDFAPDEQPAICGGAFNWSSDYLHCGAQYWFRAGYRQNLLGFRVVRARKEQQL